MEINTLKSTYLYFYSFLINIKTDMKYFKICIPALIDNTFKINNLKLIWVLMFIQMIFCNFYQFNIIVIK